MLQNCTDCTPESVFVILTDLRPDESDWAKAELLTQTIAQQSSRVLGFEPTIHLSALSPDQQWTEGDLPLFDLLTTETYDNAFVIPAILDFSIFQQQAFAECINNIRRTHPDRHIFYDAPDLCHPLLFQAFADRVCTQQINPREAGLLLVASGHGDPASRAKSYQLMRLLWEHLGVQTADVAFLRHEKTPLPEQLAKCAQQPHPWIILPQLLWNGDHSEYIRLIHTDFIKQNPLAESWPICDVLDTSDLIASWLSQRLVNLWNDHREKITTRQPSLKKQSTQPSVLHGPIESVPFENLNTELPPHTKYGSAALAEVHDTQSFAQLIEAFGIRSDPVFVKVTWHGYAPGTYTDPIALDKLLTALPGRAVLLEGHTVSRNSGDAKFDWETESRDHRAWIRDQDQAYLKKTGLQDVMDRHNAQYLNVTEAYWDGQCADPSDLQNRLSTDITHPELLEFIPQVILDHAGCDFISFARFKGPTRLSISNCFGLLPGPLRAAWHGPNLTYFAKVCCEMAKIYSDLFNPYGLVEALNVAVRWNRKGLYRSRWGHYDLIPQPGIVTLSKGLPGADMLASRLQGQDITRSAFFDVVRSEFALGEDMCTEPLDDHLIQRFS